MRPHERLVALALIALTVGGCATGHGGSLVDRFIKPGEPAVDLGGPAPVTADRAPEPERTRVDPPAERAQRLNKAGASIENLDSRLSAALMIERVFPTPENHLRVALEYRRLGILDACADRLALAIGKSPKFAAAHEQLARVWRDWGFPNLGLSSAYRAVHLQPKSASAQNTLGTLLAALGQLTAARDAYERALALDPAAAWAQNNVCDVEFRLGHLDVARTRCQAALALAPAFRAAHNNLALVLAASGDLEGARLEFLAGGDIASASYNLGIVHLAGREYASAADAFEEAIRLRPGYTAAKTRAHIARLRLLTGE